MHRTMPFGKYKGQYLYDLPTDYLRWLLTIDLHFPLFSAVQAELESRRDARPPPPPPAPPPADIKSKVRAWHRALVLKYHPDRGGSHEAMIAVNDAYDSLMLALDMGP